MKNKLYKGYIQTKGKQPVEKLKNRSEWKTYDDVKDLDGFAGVLADDTVLIDIDDSDQSEILARICDELQLYCKIYQTTRGRHFLFKNHLIERNKTHCTLAIGLTADIKLGSRLSYEVIKINGEERFVEFDIDEGDEYQEIPKWLCPIKGTADFMNMNAGDGRNQALFNYILTLQGNGFTVDETRECIRLLNKYVLKEPLPDEELEVVLRDEAFQKPTFFNDKSFLFDKFATYIRDTEHAAMINGQLHLYREGVYRNGYGDIEEIMIEHIPNLRKTQRKEVIEYLQLIAPEKEMSDANLIAFNNGLYDIVTGELREFTPDEIILNKIPWNYSRDVYSELADKTLDKLACDDPDIRALLEECIGYCFYRRNEMGKAFILTGDKSNGKSTFLNMIKNVLGGDNISALDLKELGDRFSTAVMFGKLANIGDDIGDEFLQGSQVSIFKKIVTGNRIKAERKGQDPFEFDPFVKLLFSANEIPRMKDKTGAVLRRLIIIPFNATFSKDDPDYDPFIGYKLKERECVEYLIRVGIEGLKRVLAASDFTQSQKVQQQIDDYEEENNPVIAFVREVGMNEILDHVTSEVYKRYQVFMADNGFSLPVSNIVFSRQLTKMLKIKVVLRRIGERVVRVFVAVTDGNG